METDKAQVFQWFGGIPRSTPFSPLPFCIKKPLRDVATLRESAGRLDDHVGILRLYGLLTSVFTIMVRSRETAYDEQIFVQLTRNIFRDQLQHEHWVEVVLVHEVFSPRSRRMSVSACS